MGKKQRNVKKAVGNLRHLRQLRSLLFGGKPKTDEEREADTHLMDGETGKKILKYYPHTQGYNKPYSEIENPGGVDTHDYSELETATKEAEWEGIRYRQEREAYERAEQYAREWEETHPDGIDEDCYPGGILDDQGTPEESDTDDNRP